MANDHGPFDPSESSSSPFQGSSGGRLAVVPSAAGPLAAPSFGPAAGAGWGEEPPAADGVNILNFVHALRRRWLLATLVGSALATAVAALLYFVIPVSYEASAFLKINRFDEESLVGPSTRASESPADYAIFKKSQAFLLNSPVVLGPMLAKREIENLAIFPKNETPVNWLQKEIKVDSFQEQEIVKVSMKGDRPRDIEILVNKVLDVYIEEVVDQDKKQIADRLGELRLVLKKKSEELQKLTETYYKNPLGDREQRRIKLDDMRDQLRVARTNIQDSKKRRADVESRLSVLSASIRMVDTEPGELEIANELTTYPQYNNQLVHINNLEAEISKAKDLASPRELAALKTQLREAQKKLQQLAEDLSPQAADRIRKRSGTGEADVQAQFIKLQVEQAGIQEQLTAQENQYQQLEASASSLSQTDTTMVALEEDMRAAGDLKRQLQSNIEKLELEQGRRSRIEILSRAETPQDNDRMAKWIQVIGAWCIMFGIGVMGVGSAEYLAQRINNGKDVTTGAGLRVVGSLPQLDQRGQWPGMRRDAHATQMILNFSIDAIRTAVLHHRSAAAVRSVMVTSATGREGKTTVASQLAISLARSGRRTLLIDADLRNPQQHQVFGTANAAGLSEMLRGESTLDQAVAPTAIEQLWLLPAGMYDLVSMRALAGDGIKGVLDQCLAQFDFVVVDSGPVLTSADPLIIGRCVDTAVISVRRDVSQVPKVYAAYERLQSVGVRVLGAVLNGSGSEIRPHELVVARNAARAAAENGGSANAAS